MWERKGLDTGFQSSIEEIILHIADQIEINELNITHHSGQTGIALFFAYLFKLTGKGSYKEKFEAYLTHSLEAIESTPMTYTFSSGFTGIAWTLNLLIKEKLIDVDPNEFLKDLDHHIYEISKNNFKHGVYDFMHGGLGAGIYFLDRYKDNSSIKSRISSISDQLINLAEKENGVYRWKNVKSNFKNDGLTSDEYNLGLAHGQPSIQYFLASCLQANINAEPVKTALLGNISYMISQQLPDTYDSNYPSIIKKGLEPSSSRLAWCYGDLGAAYLLSKSAEAVRMEKVKEEAINILLQTTKRRSLKLNRIKDAGICHGTAGIAHIYNRIYQKYGHEEFHDASVFWLKETLKMAKHENGVAGYMSYNDAKKRFEKNSGFLKGAAGIGLVLIGFLSDFEPRWDRGLLLS